jgi:carbamoyltransferase
MSTILGISAFYHDSAAALVIDGRIFAAAQEERFTRIKHDPAFPYRAIEYCLREAAISVADLDYVGFYDKPFTKFERLLETYLAYAPSGFRSFRLAMPLWLKDKLHMRRTLRHGLGKSSRACLVFTDHHESHAASAFFPSPFDRAAILTIDGVGEWTTAAFGIGEGNHIQLIDHIMFPHSLGLLYSAFTYYCGFKVNSGEYKLMGLAPYGQPVYRDLILERLIDLRPDGSFWLNMKYFNYCQGLTMTNSRFHRLFGGSPRPSESPLEQRHMDLAASIQAVVEEAILRVGYHVSKATGAKKLVLAGGVALNCVANGRLLREGNFDDIWIQPAAGDAGGALGVALFIWYQLLDKPRQPDGTDSQRGSLLGPSFTSGQVEACLSEQGASGQRFTSESQLADHVAGMLAEGKIVGWFQGRMEFGPRALGARSILGDPRSPEMQANMNLKIKFRESFRPFAPAVLREHAFEWFDLNREHESPYMLLVAPVLENRRVNVNAEALRTMQHDPDLRNRVNIVRSEIPAVTHVDYSARLQTVDEERNPRFYRLLDAFNRLTGCPVLVNTSFNVRGEPIVCTPEDAYRCFLATDMDVIVLENFVVTKDMATRTAGHESREAHLAQFQLD